MNREFILSNLQRNLQERLQTLWKEMCKVEGFDPEATIVTPSINNPFLFSYNTTLCALQGFKDSLERIN